MPDITEDETRRLMALRGRARRRCIVLQKSRKAISFQQQGGLMVIDGARNTVIAGSRYELDLDEAEAVVAAEITRLEASGMSTEPV